MTEIEIAIVACCVSILSFSLNWWWGKKSAKINPFAQMMGREDEVARTWVHSELGADRKDKTIACFNFFDGLACLYFENMLPKKATKKYFITILSTFYQENHTDIPDGCDELSKLLKKWDIELS